jgi:hypothetical protein
MTAGHEAVAEGQNKAQASEPPLGAAIPLSGLSANLTVMALSSVIAVRISCSKAGLSYPLASL